MAVLGAKSLDDGHTMGPRGKGKICRDTYMPRWLGNLSPSGRETGQGTKRQIEVPCGRLRDLENI